MVLNTSLVVVIAPGKRPATFRTWKLSPAAPMVLQPTGCGRVGHRHNTTQSSGQEPNGSWPLRSPTRKTPVNDRHTHKTPPNEHTRLSGKSPIEHEPHQAAWTNHYRINKPSTTCHNPSTPSLNPSTPHSTRPSPPSASKPATTVHRARGGCLRPSGYGATHERTYVAHILPLGMGC